MTAPQPTTPGSDSVREEIAEALKAARYWSSEWMPERSGAEGLAAVLVPLVDSLRAEAKAEALEEAKDVCPFLGDDVQDWLSSLAAACRTNPSSEETHRGR